MRAVNKDRLAKLGSYNAIYEPTEAEISRAIEEIQSNWSDAERYNRTLTSIWDLVPYGFDEWQICPFCGKPSEFAEKDQQPLTCMDCLELDASIQEGRFCPMGYQYSNQRPVTADRQFHGGSDNMQAGQDVWWEGI